MLILCVCPPRPFWRPQVQRCTLLSIKTGGCPENCNYCSQSSSWSESTGTKAEKLMDLEDVYQARPYLGTCFPHCRWF
jgi:biotin synthase-like enzyme